MTNTANTLSLFQRHFASTAQYTGKSKRQSLDFRLSPHVAGNAMTTPVVGAVMFGIFCFILKLSIDKEGEPKFLGFFYKVLAGGPAKPFHHHESVAVSVSVSDMTLSNN